jgi:hypothetical protein
VESRVAREASQEGRENKRERERKEGRMMMHT